MCIVKFQTEISVGSESMLDGGSVLGGEFARCEQCGVVLAQTKTENTPIDYCSYQFVIVLTNKYQVLILFWYRYWISLGDRNDTFLASLLGYCRSLLYVAYLMHHAEPPSVLMKNDAS